MVLRVVVHEVKLAFLLEEVLDLQGDLRRRIALRRNKPVPAVELRIPPGVSVNTHFLAASTAAGEMSIDKVSYPSTDAIVSASYPWWMAPLLRRQAAAQTYKTYPAASRH